MTREEMIEKAQMIRSRDRFGTMTQEELDALPGIERLLEIPANDAAGQTRLVKVFEIRPEGVEGGCLPLIINFHGGGFIKPRSDRDKRYCCTMADEMNCIVWDVDYCISPEEPFPMALYESYGVAAYAFAHAEEYGIDPARIALAGHSAGGNLVAAILILAARNKSFAPCAALMEYFPTDQTEDPEKRLPEKLKADPFWVRRAKVEKEYALMYCDEEQMKDPLCSPAFAAEEELAAFPDSLIISAGEDSLMKGTEAFAGRLVEAGVTVTAKRIAEAAHGFTVNRTPGWERALELHKKFFGQYFS